MLSSHFGNPLFISDAYEFDWMQAAFVGVGGFFLVLGIGLFAGAPTFASDFVSQNVVNAASLVSFYTSILLLFGMLLSAMGSGVVLYGVCSNT